MTKPNTLSSGNQFLRDRQSCFELLRIIAMLMIIAHHFAIHGGLNYTDKITPITTYMWFLQSGGKIGVNIYLLISGYFLISEKNLRINKIVRFWLQVFFYSLLFYAIISTYRLAITHNYVFSLREFLSVIFPISFNQWWFASTYFALYIFSPFINRFLNSIDRNYYIKLLVAMFVIWCVISTLIGNGFEYSRLSWGFFLYCLAGYFRLYRIPIFYKPKKMLLVTIACFLLVFALKIGIVALSNNSSFLKIYLEKLFAENDLLVFFISVMFFCCFKNIDIKSNSINIIASTTFGVYLIHDNTYIRQFLHNHIFAIFPINSIFLIPYSILIVFSIFIICSGIELVRKRFIEKRYSGLVRIADAKIHSLVLNLYDLILHNRFINQ